MDMRGSGGAWTARGWTLPNRQRETLVRLPEKHSSETGGKLSGIRYQALSGIRCCLIGREEHSSDFQRNTHQKLEEIYQVSSIKFQVSGAARETLASKNMRRKVLGNCREKKTNNFLLLVMGVMIPQTADGL